VDIPTHARRAAGALGLALGFTFVGFVFTVLTAQTAAFFAPAAMQTETTGLALCRAVSVELTRALFVFAVTRRSRLFWVLFGVFGGLIETVAIATPLFGVKDLTPFDWLLWGALFASKSAALSLLLFAARRRGRGAFAIAAAACFVIRAAGWLLKFDTRTAESIAAGGFLILFLALLVVAYRAAPPPAPVWREAFD